MYLNIVLFQEEKNTFVILECDPMGLWKGLQWWHVSFLLVYRECLQDGSRKRCRIQLEVCLEQQVDHEVDAPFSRLMQFSSVSISVCVTPWYAWTNLSLRQRVKMRLSCCSQSRSWACFSDSGSKSSCINEAPVVGKLAARERSASDLMANRRKYLPTTYKLGTVHAGKPD